MSILIKGMEMPTNCYKCPFCDNDAMCTVLGEDLFDHVQAEVADNLRYLPEDWKSDSCPLVPVPKHGRLIDADAAKEFLKPVDSIRDYEPEWTWGELYESNCNAIDKLPAIIPADKECDE